MDLSKELHSHNIFSWYTYAEDIIPTYIKNKLGYINNTKDIQKIKLEAKSINSEKYKTLFETKINNLDESNILFLYKQLKTSMNKEHYLSSEN